MAHYFPRARLVAGLNCFALQSPNFSSMDHPKKIIDRYTAIWRDLGFYERFEQLIAIFLTVLISIVIVFTCARLAVEVYQLLIFKDDLMDPEVFLKIFAMILTVLIALEFNHSIVQVVERKQSLVQVRIVVQIAILAIVRKFILLDMTKTSATTLYGLAAIVIALSVLYFAIRNHDPRRRDTESAQH